MADIFDFGNLGIFGDSLMTESPKKKKSEKANTKKNTKTEVKNTELSYAAPFLLVFDSISSVEIKEGSYNQKQLLVKIGEVTGFKCFSEKNANSFVIHKESDEVYYVTPNYFTQVQKGGSGKSILLKDLLELSAFLEVEEENVTAETVINQIKEKHHFEVALCQVEDVYIPIPQSKKEGNLANLKFPIGIYSLSAFGEKLELTKEDYLVFSEEAAEGSDEIKEDLKPDEKVLRKALQILYPDYLDLAYDILEKENALQLRHKKGERAKTSSSSKEEVYPTDATISLIFTRIPLSPELFGNKTEVTGKEIIRFLGKQYPEYSQERTELRYDKKQKLIMPILKSGKRGAYSLHDGKEYRIETSPIMTIVAKKERESLVPGTVFFRLPKIPFSILQEVIQFFWNVYVYQKTEAVAFIYYDTAKNDYGVHIPRQEVTASSVDFAREEWLEQASDRLLVMEIHSHGGYPAYWSLTDDQDEVMHRLYAVVGDIPGFQYDAKHIRVRGATGGYHVQVDLPQIFSFPKSEEEFCKGMENVYHVMPAAAGA